MREYYELGPVPSEEDCLQTGKDDFSLMKKECRIYQRQLERMFQGLQFGVKTFPHDFGSYCEVVVYYDSENQDEAEKVWSIESDLPAKWDNIAKEELKTIKENV